MLKVAVIGLGGNGTHKLRVLANCNRVNGLIGMDLDSERTAVVAGELGIPTTTNLDEILTDTAVKLVFVSSSNDAHKELTLAAMASNKAVLCEKPMANTLADAHEMVEAAEQGEQFLEIGFEARHSKLYATIKKWIDAGLLGEVVNTHCKYISSEFWGRNSWRVTSEGCGNMFGEKLSHYVDLPRWWIGAEVTEVYSVCAPTVVPYFEVNDNYHTTYKFSNGAVSHITFMMAPAATFRGDPLQDVIEQQEGDGHVLRFLICGTRGAAETDVFGRTIKRWQFGDSEHGMTSDLVETLTWQPADDHLYFHNTTDHTLDIVRRVDEGLPPSCPAPDAYETTRLCFAAEHSAAIGKPVQMSSFS